jgi:hypothetical protein
LSFFKHFLIPIQRQQVQTKLLNKRASVVSGKPFGKDEYEKPEESFSDGKQLFRLLTLMV